MTAEEARTFLKITDEDELLDAYETALFEIRQFLLSKPVLIKTFQARQSKLKQIQEAFKALGGIEKEPVEIPEIEFQPSENTLEHFSRYHQVKSGLKQQLVRAEDTVSTGHLLEAFIQLERTFVAPFAAYTDWTAAAILVSKEADVMLVLSLLREQSGKGFKTLSELYKNRNKLPEELAYELKRLSLHQNYLYDE